jgi:hypothetical protein
MHPYRLQALALLGQSAGVALLLAVLVFAGWRTPTGGLDWEHSVLTWVGAAVPAVLIIWAHVAIARQLLAAERRLRADSR